MTDQHASPKPVRPGKLAIGFLGGGLNSAVGEAHVNATAMDTRYELQAGCFSRHADINRQTAEAYRVDPGRAYDSLNAMLAAEAGKLDAIAILTPTDQHGPHVLACINAGVPVICEKALACSYEDILAIQSALRVRQGFLAVTYNYPGYPMMRELAHLIGQKRFGDIRQIHIEMPQEGFMKVKADGSPFVPQKWRLRDAEVPTVSLDLGDHLQIMTRFLTGEEPIGAVSLYNTFGNFPQIVDDVNCLIRYTGGMVANSWYSKAALGNRNGLRVRVFGNMGAAEWYQEAPEFLHVADSQGRRYILDRGHPDATVSSQARYQRFKPGHPSGYIEAFANTYYDIADQLLAYKESRSLDNGFVFGIDDALRGFRLFQALSESAKHKRWIDVRGINSATFNVDDIEYQLTPGRRGLPSFSETELKVVTG